MFVNFSNHPSAKWDDKQIKAAKKYGEIIDIPFPSVSPLFNEEEIQELAKKYAMEVSDKAGESGAAMVQGEFTLTYAVVELLKHNNIRVLSACSERSVTEENDQTGNTVRVARFNFVRFREYT